MKRLLFVTDDEGKQVLSVLRTVVGIMTTLLVGALFTWFTWVTTQAYDVATNKQLIRETGIRLEKKIGINSQDIIMNNGEVEDTLESLKTKLDARFDRINGILHGRINKVDDKYDEKAVELQKLVMETNKLVVEILIQKNKDVELQKKEVYIQQKILDENGHNK
jgi:hypothetical protein